MTVQVGWSSLFSLGRHLDDALPLIISLVADTLFDGDDLNHLV